MKSDHWRQFCGITFQMSFYSTLERCHYQMKDGRFVVEVIGTEFKMLESYRFFCKCVQVYRHKLTVPSTCTARAVGYLLVSWWCAHLKGLLEGYSVSLWLHYFFLCCCCCFIKLQVLSSSLVCTIVPILVFLFCFGSCFLTCFWESHLFLGLQLVCLCVCLGALCGVWLANFPSISH